MAKSKCGDKLAKLEESLDVSPLCHASPPGRVLDQPLLSWGSTLLNLACAGDWAGGLLPGKYYLLVGDAAAGKTFLAVTCLAEACQNSNYKHYRLIYDNVEDGCLLDLPTLFNRRVEERICSPAVDAGGALVYSSSVEEFYFHLDDAINQGAPFIYVLDSMDSLTCAAEKEKFEKFKKAARAGQKISGSYGVDKARKNSEYLRKALPGLRDTGSILLILAQTRDDLGFGFQRRTRSGGHALRFYATTEIWMSIQGGIKRHIRGRDRQIGVRISLQLRKNRITGKLLECELDIYPSYGIDDLGSCVDYLVEEGWWKTVKQTIQAESLKIAGTRAKLIGQIEEAGLEERVRKEVGRCWCEIDRAGNLKRKGRYALDSD